MQSQSAKAFNPLTANMCQNMCCAALCILQTEPVSEAKLKAAAGLAQLDGRRYKAAARAFVSVNPELGTTYSEVKFSTPKRFFEPPCAQQQRHTTSSCMACEV
jgi:hypothetical protein